MKKEVVQDFLNVPGIAGVALMDGRSRPYFLGLDQALNSQQKETLALGIQQVIETTPTDFEFFEFQFVGHQVHIYKLPHDIILLVLTRDGLVHSNFVQAIAKLKEELQAYDANAIASFRLFAGAAIPAAPGNAAQARSDGHAEPPTTPTPSSDGSPPASTQTSPLTANEPVSISGQDLLTALNQLSAFAQQYLGGTMVSNYLKASRPTLDWLADFEIERSGTVSCSPGTLSITLTPSQQQAVQQWIAAFVQRCSVVIRDFPNLIQQVDLSESQKSLLFSKLFSS